VPYWGDRVSEPHLERRDSDKSKRKRGMNQREGWWGACTWEMLSVKIGS